MCSFSWCVSPSPTQQHANIGVLFFKKTKTKTKTNSRRLELRLSLCLSRATTTKKRTPQNCCCSITQFAMANLSRRRSACVAIDDGDECTRREQTRDEIRQIDCNRRRIDVVTSLVMLFDERRAFVSAMCVVRNTRHSVRNESR